MSLKYCFSNVFSTKYVPFRTSGFIINGYRGLSKARASRISNSRSSDGTKSELTSKQVMKVVFDSVARQLMMADIYPKYKSENISGHSHKPLWRTRLKLLWPKEIDFEGTGITKVTAERAAASNALSKLKELGVLGHDNVPVVSKPSGNKPADEFGHLHPTMLLYQICQNVCNAFNSYDFKPNYVTTMKGAFPLPVWETTLTLAWPTQETFSATACKKGDAEKEASALAIKHLRKISAIDKQLNPLIHTAEEIREFCSDQRSPLMLTLSSTILNRIDAFVKDVNNSKLSNTIESEMVLPNLVRDESFEQWSDEDPAGVPAEFPLSSIFDERHEEVVSSCLENAPISNVGGDILDAFTGQLYKTPEQRLLESRNLQLYQRTLDSKFDKVKSIDANTPLLTVLEQRHKILDTVAANPVVVLVGDTGCGKTTQVPQFLLDEYASRMVGSECNMVVTQPRRISAFAVARRVAEERGERLGDRSGTVGYQVRLAGVTPLRPGRVLFCSTGILLRRLRQNPDLLGVSHVIVDEVHERDTLIDLLLTLLRDLVGRRGDLRVLLMSATIDHERLSRYFGGCPVLHCPGFLHPVKEHHLPDIRRSFRLATTDVNKKEQNSVTTRYCCNVEEVAELVAAINQDRPKEGAILCFLPGWKEITAVRERLQKKLPDMDGHWILPLHSKLSQSDQAKIFDAPPAGIRKIILATNIAESSITVNDVVYVIDSGLQREMHYDPHRGVAFLDTLLITQANARQRMGRAGRTQPGECFRLYPTEMMKTMRDYPVPAMQRAPLESTILDIKAYFPESRAIDVLSRTPDPPDPFLVSRAVRELRYTGILNDYEKLTPLGRSILHFGLQPRLAKAVVYSSLFGCVDPMITMAAVVSNNKNIFLKSDDVKNNAKEIKRKFSANENSDHLVYVNAFNAWLRADPSDAKHFCEENCLDADALSYASGLRNQLAFYLRETKLVPSVQSCFDYNSEVNRHSQDVLILKTLLAATLSPHMLHWRKGSVHKGRIKRDSNVFINQDGVNVDIRNDSINANNSTVESSWLVYFHSLHSADRKLEVVGETSSVPLLALLIFAGEELTIHRFEQEPNKNGNEERVILAIGGSDVFRCSCSKKDAETLRLFRRATGVLLNWLLAHPMADSRETNSEVASFGSDFYPSTNKVLIGSSSESDGRVSHTEPTTVQHIRKLRWDMIDIVSTLLREEATQYRKNTALRA